MVDTTSYSSVSPTSAAGPHPLTVLEPPPARRRRSVWAEIFAAARQHPDAWIRVTRPLAETTARQMASDIRSAHRREAERRPSGLQEGEVWDATWGALDDQYFVWVRFVASPGGSVPDLG